MLIIYSLAGRCDSNCSLNHQTSTTTFPDQYLTSVSNSMHPTNLDPTPPSPFHHRSTQCTPKIQSNYHPHSQVPTTPTSLRHQISNAPHAKITHNPPPPKNTKTARCTLHAACCMQALVLLSAKLNMKQRFSKPPDPKPPSR